MVENIKINGYSIFPFSSKEEFLDYLNTKNLNNILIALNAEKLIKEDTELRKIVNDNIGYPDGIGAVWALRKAGKKAIKIPGAEFWLDIIEAFHKEKTFYLVGGKPEVMDATITKLIRQFPSLKIIGHLDGYFNREKYQELIKDIIEKKPDIVYVAMGSPKQEFIMRELQHHHPALYMGLGGSFDVYVGEVQRAPKAWVSLNLEWAYRLVKQPSRILRQHVLLKFMYKLVIGKL